MYFNEISFCMQHQSYAHQRTHMQSMGGNHAVSSTDNDTMRRIVLATITQVWTTRWSAVLTDTLTVQTKRTIARVIHLLMVTLPSINTFEIAGLLWNKTNEKWVMSKWLFFKKALYLDLVVFSRVLPSQPYIQAHWVRPGVYDRLGHYDCS